MNRAKRENRSSSKPARRRSSSAGASASLVRLRGCFRSLNRIGQTSSGRADQFLSSHVQRYLTSSNFFQLHPTSSNAIQQHSNAKHPTLQHYNASINTGHRRRTSHSQGFEGNPFFRGLHD